jgi:hypothetical protein
MRAIVSLVAFGCVSALANPTVSSQSVWVVDDVPGPGVNFVTIQDAVDAAADRDIVLVRGGAYPGFSIVGKGLVVTADAGALVFLSLSTQVVVKGTAPGQSTILRGLGGFANLLAQDVNGPLWIEDCDFAPQNFFAETAIQLVSCASVSIARTTAKGSTAISQFASFGGHGLHAITSQVAAYDSKFIGAVGSSIVPAGAYAGGSGASVAGGSLYAARCVFQGGAGGNSLGTGGASGAEGAGGHGIDSSSTTSVTTVNGQYSGGAGGAGSNGGPAGAPGAPLALQGTFTPHTAPKFLYFADSPVREQQALVFHFDIDIATDFYLFVAADPGLVLPVGGVFGPLLLDPAALGFVFLGRIPSGPSLLSIPTHNLPPTVAGFVLATQAIFLDPSLTFLEIGSPSHLTILDSTF